MVTLLANMNPVCGLWIRNLIDAKVKLTYILVNMLSYYSNDVYASQNYHSLQSEPSALALNKYCKFAGL